MEPLLTGIGIKGTKGAGGVQEVNKSSELPALIDHERPNSSSGGRGAGATPSRPAESEAIEGYPDKSPVGTPRGTPEKVVKRRGMLWAKFQKATDPSLSSTADTAQSSTGDKDLEVRRDSPPQSSLPPAEDPKRAKITRRHSTIDGFPSYRLEEMKASMPKRHSTTENSLPEMGREIQKSPQSLEEGSEDSKKALFKRSQSESFLTNKKISRRHSTMEELSSSSSPDKASVPRKFSTIEGMPSRSSSSTSRRASCPGGMDPGELDVLPEEQAESQPERKKSVMDMSPRTARKFLIHQHRMGSEESSDGGHHSPSRHHHGHGHGHGHGHRRGSRLGAESLAIIAEKKEEADKQAAIDPTLHGFLVGDAVSVEGGPDEQGPFKSMGEGRVDQGKLPYKKGMVNVFFVATRECFNIKACNLFNLTDPMRSGENMLYMTRKKHRGRMPGATTYIEKDSTTGKDDKGLRRQAHTIEATEFMSGSTMEAAGIAPGDLVGSADRGGVLGTVIKEGKNGEIFVRMGELGIRSFNVCLLTKIRSTEDEKEDRAFRASCVDTKARKNYTITMDEANGPFGQTKEEKAKADAASIANGGVDPMSGLKKGDFVKIKDADDNPMWAMLGIGVVRGPGDKAGTMQVQFDCGGEYWTFFIDKLVAVPKAEGSDRKFTITDAAQLRRRGSI